MQPQFRLLGQDEWLVLRDMRLRALRESSLSFLAKYDQERRYGHGRWQTEFDRGDWVVGDLDGKQVCLAGVTRQSGASRDERYLEYVWVAPRFRRQHTAFDMLTYIIRELKDRSVRTVFLWTLLEDNDAAQWLYKQLDFITTSEKQELEGRWWERLKCELI